MSALIKPSGEPLATKSGDKAPPEDVQTFLANMADGVLMIEREAFKLQPGVFLMKLEAARIAECVIERILTVEQIKRMAVQLAPHLFAKVRIVSAPPAPTKCYVKTHEVRDAFDGMIRNGYNGIPIMGLSPAEIIDQAEVDAKVIAGRRVQRIAPRVAVAVQMGHTISPHLKEGST